MVIQIQTRSLAVNESAERCPIMALLASHLEPAYTSDSTVGEESRMIGCLAREEVENTVAQRLPHLLREKQLRWNESDKIFTSQWLSESSVLVGTKCNKVSMHEMRGGAALWLIIFPHNHTAVSSGHSQPLPSSSFSGDTHTVQQTRGAGACPVFGDPLCYNESRR